MKKKICFFAIVITFLIACFGLVGCGDNRVGGTYKATFIEFEQTSTITMILREDGTCKISKSTFGVTNDRIYNGTYTVSGDKIIFDLRWTEDTQYQGQFTGKILKSGSISLTLYAKTLTYNKV